MWGAGVAALDTGAGRRGTQPRVWAWSDRLEGVGAGKGGGKPREKDGHIVDSVMATVPPVEWGWAMG